MVSASFASPWEGEAPAEPGAGGSVSHHSRLGRSLALPRLAGGATAPHGDVSFACEMKAAPVSPSFSMRTRSVSPLTWAASIGIVSHLKPS